MTAPAFRAALTASRYRVFAGFAPGVQSTGASVDAAHAPRIAAPPGRRSVDAASRDRDAASREPGRHLPRTACRRSEKG